MEKDIYKHATLSSCKKSVMFQMVSQKEQEADSRKKKKEQKQRCVG